MLVNGKGNVYNNFPNKLVDQQIRLYLQNINKNDNTTNNTNRIYITETKCTISTN